MTNNRNNILKDKVLICTYPQKDADELAEILVSNGAKVISIPLIETIPLPFELKKDITTYDWIVFTSKNAVDPFAKKHSVLSNKVAALGEKTAEKLIQHHFQPAFTGSGKSATDFGNEFKKIIQPDDKVLLVLGNLAPDTLTNLLSQHVQVDRVNVYQTIGVQSVNQDVLNQIHDGQYSALIVTSPSAYYELKKHLPEPSSPLKIFSIGKTTTSALQKDEVEPLATSNEASYVGLANTVIEYFSKKTIKN